MPTSRRVTYRVPLLYNAIELHATMLALTSAEEAVLKRLVNLDLRRIWLAGDPQVLKGLDRS